MSRPLLAAIAMSVAAAARPSLAQESASSTPPVFQPVATPVPPPVIGMVAPIVIQPVPTASVTGDAIPHPAAGVLELRASLSGRTLTVVRGDSLLGQYAVSVGADEHPTPRGDFWIERIVWNPRWVPPDAAWAKGKTPKDPGSPANPMKLVKIFFQEPDYYIHGTGALESLGKAESHGCLRMDPDQAAEVAKLLMEHGGQPREENWFWRLLHFRREEKTVTLDNPIRFVVDE